MKEQDRATTEFSMAARLLAAITARNRYMQERMTGLGSGPTRQAAREYDLSPILVLHGTLKGISNEKDAEEFIMEFIYAELAGKRHAI